VKSCEGCDNSECLSERRYVFDVDGVWHDYTHKPVAGESRDAVRGKVEDGKDRGGV